MWLSDDARNAYTTDFPTGPSPTKPVSLSSILGDSNSVAGNLVHVFVRMSPYDYNFPRPKRLTVENSHDPNGRHDVLAKIDLVKGIGSVETTSTPDGIYMKSSPELTLWNIDFELTDHLGNIFNLRGRSLSFEFCFD